MTDDLDRRMDARIARAWRMAADKAQGTWKGTAEFCREIADALDPPERLLVILPCPWCLKQPKGGPDYVECQTDGCTLQGYQFSVAFWNRRAEVPHG